jgi:hypothetical protein
MKAEVERISTLEFYCKRNGAYVLGPIKLNQYLRVTGGYLKAGTSLLKRVTGRIFNEYSYFYL